MIDLAQFHNLHLQGGFIIVEVESTREAMLDALNREAVAQTRIIGNRFHVQLRSGISNEEVSISLYHEVLEAATVASLSAPENVMEFNEGDFERAAQTAHAQFGPATPDNLNRLLQSYGFQGE
ncbi:MAG: hypothetical protein RLY20_1772 [Verrucomicrobiota bacterium]|jgi:hypothetical protein